MLAEIGQQVDLFVTQSKAYLGTWLLVIAGLWAFNLFHWLTGKRLNVLGLQPRRVIGLLGIVFAPFLHANANHLFFNCIPLFMLGLFMLGDGTIVFTLATMVIMLGNGLVVWLIGRRGVHIGASGVIAGYFGYVLASAWQAPTFTTIMLGLIALYYFGGILLSVLPTEDSVSWEGHLSGILSGVLARVGMPYLLNLSLFY